MARTVEDVALLLDAMVNEDPRDPISLPRTGESYVAAARTPQPLVRVAFSPDLGVTPVDAEMAEICRKAAWRFTEIGIAVEEAHPDLSGAKNAFQTLRAVSFAAAHRKKLEDCPDLLKPEMIWNIEKGLRLSASEIATAEEQRAEIIRQTHAFFSHYDLLLTPATIVPPYPVQARYVDECSGVKFDNYIDWLAIAYSISLTTAPAMSLPCGFTKDGLPVGLQIVARPRGEARLLSGAAQLERLLDLSTVHPIDPRTPS